MSFKTILLFLCLTFSSIQSIDFSSEYPFSEKNSPGLIPIDSNTDIFYWLFPSRQSPESDPLVFWLSGGPGCSSGLAALLENGPFTLSEGKLTINKNSWNSKSNLVFIDQPIGTGFSKGDTSKLPHDENEVATQFGIFLEGFFKNHPEFKDRPFYITGESYAGHYIPFIGSYIIEDRDKWGALGVNLQGVAIGNGWVDPYTQYAGYSVFALENGLINETGKSMLDAGYAICRDLVKNKRPVTDMNVCNMMMGMVLGNPPKFNVYDIRRECEVPPLCYDFSGLGEFFNRNDVRNSLGVSGRNWLDCDPTVHAALLNDLPSDASGKVAYLLDNEVNVLVYNGDKDYICNWKGGEMWVEALEWERAEEFRKAEVKDIGTGTLKQYKNFAFYRIYDAGHMVPMDQPKVALDMLNTFIGQQEIV